MKLAILAAFTLTVSGASAQTAPRSAADAANAFSLDIPAPQPAPTASVVTPSAPAGSPDAQPHVAATSGSFTLDTPIAQLIADPRAKAVLDKDLPGLSDDSNLPKFQSYSLRQFQPMTGGQMSTALLEKTGADLVAIGGAIPIYAPPPSPAAADSNKRLESGR